MQSKAMQRERDREREREREIRFEISAEAHFVSDFGPATLGTDAVSPSSSIPLTTSPVFFWICSPAFIAFMGSLSSSSQPGRLFHIRGVEAFFFYGPRPEIGYVAAGACLLVSLFFSIHVGLSSFGLVSRSTCLGGSEGVGCITPPLI